MDRYQKLADLYSKADAVCLAYPSPLGDRVNDPVTDEAKASVRALFKGINAFAVDRDEAAEIEGAKEFYNADFDDVARWIVSDVARALPPAVVGITVAKYAIVRRRLPIYAVAEGKELDHFAKNFKTIVLA